MEQFLSLHSLIFIASLTTTAVFTPPIIRLASKHEIVDLPGLHKTHIKSKPLLGGLAIMLGFLLTVLFFLDYSPKLGSLLLGAFILLVVGIIDDVGNMRAIYKLAGQTAAAVAVVSLNAQHFQIFVGTLGRFGVPEGVTLLLLIGWIVLMINAFNLIDGMDGLASGTGGIIFMAMAIISMLNGGSSNLIALQIAGAGACFGFLFYNFNPARIFMGDTGSMLIGYLLATTYLMSVNTSFDLYLILGSMLIFAYPALDTSFAIIRRLKNRTSIFKADKSHIHHIIMGLGYSVRKTVLILYFFNILFCALAIFVLCVYIPVTLLVMIGLSMIILTYVLMVRLSTLAHKNGISDL